VGINAMTGLPEAKSAPSEAGLGSRLRHYDPMQLWYQVAEVVNGNAYGRFGIHVSEGETVFDVGANVGVASAYFAHVCRAGTVHSFEPVRPVFDLLEENLRQFPACVVHNVGLAAGPGTAEITWYPGAAAMSSLYADRERDRDHVRRCMVNGGVEESTADARSAESFAEQVTLTCELRSLSSVIEDESVEQIDLLKVDVEGAELEVLEGIEPRHWPRIRQIVLEVHSDEAKLAVTDTLTSHGMSVLTEQDAVHEGTGVSMLYGLRR